MALPPPPQGVAPILVIGAKSTPFRDFYHRFLRVAASAENGLVAPTTDPGWTPLFLLAGALIMEVGGVISHGAVVAREYGIPAVAAVADATVRLRTGQRVVVDGSNGTVTPIERSGQSTASSPPPQISAVT